MQDREIAYAAGFFDGEGHIRITKHSKRGSYTLQLSAVQATLDPLPLFERVFGGTINRRLVKYRQTPRAIYTWQASSGVAELALRRMLPYLIAKKDEAELALSFRETFRPQFGNRSKTAPEVEEKRRALMICLQDARKQKRSDALTRDQTLAA